MYTRVCCLLSISNPSPLRCYSVHSHLPPSIWPLWSFDLFWTPRQGLTQGARIYTHTHSHYTQINCVALCVCWQLCIYAFEELKGSVQNPTKWHFLKIDFRYLFEFRNLYIIYLVQKISENHKKCHMFLYEPPQVSIPTIRAYMVIIYAIDVLRYLLGILAFVRMRYR